jgi:lysophospholipase L1-like esterase
MRAVVTALSCAIAGLLSVAGGVRAQPTTPAPAPTIEWRLENSFRLFKRAEDTRKLRDAYRALAAQSGRPPTALEFERHLATATDGWGWSEALVGHVIQDACWYRRDAECSTYARPTSHLVDVRLPDHAGLCTWQVGGAPATAAPASCSTPMTVEIPYPAGADIAALVDGAPVATARIEVKDRLIVSLGDSFASGEGNPDRAVRFQRGRVVRYGTTDPRLRGYPARVGDWRNTGDQVFTEGGAQWLHRPCHRSLYSAHARVALQLALADADEHTAVTFLGVACTAAEIENGLFMPHMGNDREGSDELVTLSQLSGVTRAICAPGSTALGTASYGLRAMEGNAGRERTHRIFTCPKEQARAIDLLLLSIGGNDIGFSKLVAWASLSDVAESALKGTLTRDPARARPYLSALRHNYGEVDRAVRDALHVEPARVVLMAYPRMGFNESGAPCGSGRAGMDVSPVFSFFGSRATSVERFAETELTPLMREVAAKHGWQWADAHREMSRRHGFCAKGGDEGMAGAGAGPGEMAFPFRRADRGGAADPSPFSAAATTGFGSRPKPKAPPQEGGARAVGWLETAPPATEWMPYPPNEFRPYLQRTRWYRSPNDAFLTVNLHYGKVGDRVSLTHFVASSGAFHPNAQGHAAAADAIREAIERTGVLK